MIALPLKSAPTSGAVLEVQGLSVEYGLRGNKVAAVADVSLHINAGEVVGLVGESGSGKSTVALASVGLVRSTAGGIRVLGRDIPTSGGRWSRSQRADVQIVFQDPHGSLDPRQSVRAGFRELRTLHQARTSWIRDDDVLADVGLSSNVLDLFPYQLSGGQAQRVVFARSLLLRPKLLVADEPTSALDVSVQAHLLRLLLSLRDEHNIAVLFITHDIRVVRHVCDRVYVMHEGSIIEGGQTEQVLTLPKHVYTQRLIGAVPEIDMAVPPIDVSAPSARHDLAPISLPDSSVAPEGSALPSAGKVQLRSDIDPDMVGPSVRGLAIWRPSMATGTGARFVIRAGLGAGATLFVAIIVAFILGRSAGDPVRALLGEFASPQQVAATRHQLGLDEPLPSQFVAYLSDLSHGDLGHSLRYGESNWSLIAGRLGASLQLVLGAMFLAGIIGLPLGVIAALKQGTVVDRIVTTLAVIGQSVPAFWLGLMMIILFSLRLGWLPAGQGGTPQHLVLPAVTLALFPLARLARVMRAGMSAVLREAYITSARARGLSERRVVLVHALRNAALPVLTLFGLQAASLLTGAITVEYVFAWPGLGQLATTAVQARDFSLVQAIVVLGAVIFVVVNLTVDILYGLLDPRVRDTTR